MTMIARQLRPTLRNPLQYMLLYMLAILVGCSSGSESEKITKRVATITAASSDADAPGHELQRDATPRKLVADNRVISGNRVELLLDGPETYNEMFRAIADARDHINLETFILADDDIGRKLADALAERARNGVIVNVIYDAIGSKSTDESFFDDLRDRGVSLLAYRPLSETAPSDWLNRNHRKILVVDGHVGFTGGLNFTKEYRYRSQTTNRGSEFAEGWRDTHLKIEGPAVEILQREFLRIWQDSNEEKRIANANYFPGTSEKGTHDVVIVAAEGDGEQSSTIVDYYAQAIDAAAARIWMTQAYFSPTDELIRRLKNAAERGVDVRLLLPGESDVELAELAARAHYGELLDSGVRIYQFVDGILHAKTALVDDQWSTVGSSNLDLLSIKYNNELNAIVLDQQFTRQLAETFERDLQRADEVTIEEWNDRSIWTKAKHAISKIAQLGLRS